jgi:hypothetical protein
MAVGVAFRDADKFVITLAGIRLQGFADGEFLTAKRTQAGFIRVVGTDGEVARSKSLDKTGEFVVKLLQTSKSNQDLSTLHNLDLNAPNGAGVGAFLMQDLQGNDIITASQAWIVQFPDGSMDRSATPLEWMIQTGETVWNYGGNH